MRSWRRVVRREDSPSSPSMPSTPTPPTPERFASDTMQSLANSIREVGVLQPIVVRPAGADGRHVLVAGERRLRAARMAGLVEIPAVIRDGDDQGRLVEAVVENVQREGPRSPRGSRRLPDPHGRFWTDTRSGGGAGGKEPLGGDEQRSSPRGAGAIQALLVSGKLSAGAARALLGTDDTAYAVRIANKAAAEGWSVRQVEEAMRVRQTGRQGGDQDAAGQKGSLGADPCPRGSASASVSAHR